MTLYVANIVFLALVWVNMRVMHLVNKRGFKYTLALLVLVTATLIVGFYVPLGSRTISPPICYDGPLVTKRLRLISGDTLQNAPVQFPDAKNSAPRWPISGGCDPVSPVKYELYLF